MRRKQLGNALRSVAGLSAEKAADVLRSVGIDPQARPETLSPAEFVSLMRASGS
jgi:16S rRNA (adenine1518-N6/adenine1519-N6)-dimethyltransferase